MLYTQMYILLELIVPLEYMNTSRSLTLDAIKLLNIYDRVHYQEFTLIPYALLELLPLLHIGSYLGVI